jgi:hypothetical protein
MGNECAAAVYTGEERKFYLEYILCFTAFTGIYNKVLSGRYVSACLSSYSMSDGFYTWFAFWVFIQQGKITLGAYNCAFYV